MTMMMIGTQRNEMHNKPLFRSREIASRSFEMISRAHEIERRDYQHVPSRAPCDDNDDGGSDNDDDDY